MPSLFLLMIDLVDLLGKSLSISAMDLFQVLMKKKKKMLISKD